MTTNDEPVFATGALCPEQFAWQAGKTAASIAFVNEAEPFLMNEKDPVKFTKLKDEIDRVKSGEKVLEWYIEDIEGYIENL